MNLQIAVYRKKYPAADRWAAGYGQIDRNLETQTRVFAMAERLSEEGYDRDRLFDLLSALDRVTSAAMWLVVHEVYARNVHLDGRDLTPDEFKTKPEGHTGGSLNMVPAYTGYMAINAITGQTRSWLMGQGHCVSAIDSVNLLLDNLLPAHAERYSLTDEGLSRYVRDFYSYRLTDRGKQDSPLGSHVNPHTAGGMAEGGYLGFVQLEYAHMPLPGERLVTFLSDGAFEEQRGSDWTPRWWRAEDCGLVTPIMINNGRRIDQRSTMAQKGGTDWFIEHLKLNSFDPIVIDGAEELQQRFNAGERYFAGVDLTDADLSDMDLSEIQLAGASLNGANLRGARLKGADLSNSDLRQADLSTANLTGVSLYEADLQGANLTQAQLDQASLQSANLTKADLSQANLIQSDFSAANLTEANLTAVDLGKATYKKTDFSYANLREANLSQVNLDDLILNNTLLPEGL